MGRVSDAAGISVMIFVTKGESRARHPSTSSTIRAAAMADAAGVCAGAIFLGGVTMQICYRL
jgi:hypothetical protein